MPTPRRSSPRSLPEPMRRKLEVTTAMAWESLVETHVAEATAFIRRLDDLSPVEETLTRYLREMDLTETMATAVRTRVLLGLGELSAHHTDAHPADDDETLWQRFRPSAVVKEVKDRQRRGEEMDRITMLLLARSEEAVIGTHVENAIGFAALLDGTTTLDRAVQHNMGAVNLAGCRGQVVFHRTMARLADVHLTPGS